jgi:hypothetical protein
VTATPGPLGELDAPELLAWLGRWNRQLARLSALVLIEVDDARGLPIEELRSVVAITAQHVTAVLRVATW